MRSRLFRCFTLVIGGAFCSAAWSLSAQTAPSMLSYAVQGSEHVRSYAVSTGWSESVRSFAGQFDLLATTEARLRKRYPDGSEVSHDLILQWSVDPVAPVQTGNAVEVPDPADLTIERTTYVISLQYDGLRYTMSGTFMTRAYMSVLPGIYDWFNVAYGDFSGVVISPLGNYKVTGVEKAGKTAATYNGTVTITSTTAALLTRIYADGDTVTVNLAFDPPLDLVAAQQTVTATQSQNQNYQLTSYTITLSLVDTMFAVDGSYSTAATRGKARDISVGLFTGSQQ